MRFASARRVATKRISVGNYGEVGEGRTYDARGAGADDDRVPVRGRPVCGGGREYGKEEEEEKSQGTDCMHGFASASRNAMDMFERVEMEPDK